MTAFNTYTYMVVVLKSADTARGFEPLLVSSLSDGGDTQAALRDDMTKVKERMRQLSLKAEAEAQGERDAGKESHAGD
jgi:hypothetical protein